MAVYWTMFLIPVVAVYLGLDEENRHMNLLWWVLGTVYAILLGLRDQIGADWESYRNHYELTWQETLTDALVTSDPAFALLNWVAARVGWDIYAVNLFGAVVFVFGVILFCRRQPFPLLALAVSIPYLWIVVAMGYNRQGMAIGLVLIGLVLLMEGKTRPYWALVVLAALFHKSALIMIPFGMVGQKANPLRALAISLALVVIFGAVLFQTQYDLLVANYLETRLVSEGGRIRVLMNAVAALTLFAYRKRFRALHPDAPLWQAIAVASLVAFFLVDLSSTAIDRIALYFIPLQLVVFSRLPFLLPTRALGMQAVFAVTLGYGGFLWAWFTFGNYTYCWLPYRNVLMAF